MEDINPNSCPETLSIVTQALAIQQPSPVQKLTLNWPNFNNVSLHVKRDDLLHPIISGNKWRKLKYSLSHAQKNNVEHIISFGGGFSNHLHALGYCCKQLNIKFTAIVRGDYSTNLSPMLRDLMSWQTTIHYVDKITYQQRNKSEYLQFLQQQHVNALIIPEGGSNRLALQGVGEIVTELENDYDCIIAPVASGGTLAGLIKATHNTPTKVLGIGVLKGQGYLEELVSNMLPKEMSAKEHQHWSINHDYHFGGYAKFSPELQGFCMNFCQQTHIKIEPIYSAKLFFALHDLLAQGFFPMGSNILALHTGGLQGARI